MEIRWREKKKKRKKSEASSPGSFSFKLMNISKNKLHVFLTVSVLLSHKSLSHSLSLPLFSPSFFASCSSTPSHDHDITLPIFCCLQFESSPKRREKAVRDFILTNCIQISNFKCILLFPFKTLKNCQCDPSFQLSTHSNLSFQSNISFRKM